MIQIDQIMSFYAQIVMLFIEIIIGSDYRIILLLHFYVIIVNVQINYQYQCTS
jgi:hypothetical protein